MNFVDASNEYRMRIRDIVDDNGGAILDYNTAGGITIAQPNMLDMMANMQKALEAEGMLTDGTVTYFPLGTDNAPQHQRHYGPGTAAAPRGDTPSYWRYIRFTLKPELEHSPAPWKVKVWDYNGEKPPRKELIIESKTHRLAQVETDFSDDPNPYAVPLKEAKGNAALMAAAPYLLEALKDIMLIMDNQGLRNTPAKNKAREAIKKAEAKL